MFILSALLAAAPSHSAVLDPCSFWLATTEHPPEIYEQPTWPTRKHLSVARGGRAVTLERGDHAPGSVQLFSIALPVYRELYNGNLKRLLGQIARQTVSPRRVQVIVMVNNSIKAALNANDPIFIENQRTVAWLKQIRSELPFRLEVIDETRGIDRVMGVMRNRALNFAMSSTDVDPRRHVMINLDADVTITPDYLQRLDAYYGPFDIDAVITRRGHTLPSTVDPVHFQLMGVSEYGHVNHDVENVADFPNRGYVTPQITARASVVRELGGFGYIDFEEDFDFGRRLGHHTLVMAPDIYVAQSDRARDDGFAAAKRARIINKTFLSNGRIARGSPKTLTITERALTALRPLLARLEHQVQEQRLSGYEALADFEKAARPLFLHELDSPLPLGAAVPRDLLAQVDALGRPSSDLGQSLLVSQLAAHPPYGRSYDVGSYFMAVLSAALRGDELRRFNDRRDHRRAFERRLIAMRLHTIRSLLRGKLLEPSTRSDIFNDHLRDPRSALRQDIDEQLRRRKRESANHEQRPTSEDALIEILAHRYPDFLDESLSDSWVVQNQALRFLNDWFLRARAQPEDYPGTMQFLALRPLR